MSLTPDQARVLSMAVHEAQDFKSLRRVLIRLIQMLTEGEGV